VTPTSAERGKETRVRLLDAASQLIAEEGWGAVTTRKVADRAGLRPGLVHYHFSTVTDLLIDASLGEVRHEVEGSLAALRREIDPAAGVEQVLAMAEGYTPDDQLTVLFTEVLLAATRHPRLRTELAALIREFRAALADWLRASAGLDDAEATAVVFSALLDGLVLHRLVDPSLTAQPITGPLRRLVGAKESTDATGTKDATDAGRG
jgi:AcrR family transcriptional regulator